MKIKELFEKDINRNIPGVITVQLADEESIKNEILEYVITREVKDILHTFFESYEVSIKNKWSDIGVWTTGFFGSGKSHLLKMISYILSNKEIDGKKALDYFRDKIDDEFLIKSMESCASVPTEAIIFNIDAEGPVQKDATAILRVFATVFYNYIGLYGTDIRIATFEKALISVGKYDEFKTEFEKQTGKNWIDNRNTMMMKFPTITKVLMVVFNETLEDAKVRLSENTKENLSITTLSNEIKEYINSKGSKQRLLFFVDEVGQYIGTDTSLMLNLQNIVEELGRLCEGRVWVFVTSQESIDSSFQVKGNDFSKILGRFKTRMALSSSAVDEVIKIRILEKNLHTLPQLKYIYNQNSTILKNLFVFEHAIADLKGYRSEEDFIESYPFIPYQFKLLQKTFNEIRKHGAAGKHMSDGARSMLSGFQEALQMVQDKDLKALVPFTYFFDTINTFLEGSIRQVFVRCQNAAINHDGLELEDVETLKLLFLVRYTEKEIKSNLENLCVLSIDNIDFDKIAYKEKLKKSLDRLIDQSYVTRQGDNYLFLTDDEQDIAKEIKNVIIDGSKIIKSLGDLIFNDIYSSNKIDYAGKKYSFSFKKVLDGMEFSNQSFPLELSILTNVGSLEEEIQKTLLADPTTEGKATIVLADQKQYFDDTRLAEQIRTFAKTKILSELTESQRKVVQSRQEEASRLTRNVRELLSKAIIEGRYFLGRQEISITGSQPKDKIDSLMSMLISQVYSKNQLVDTFYNDDSDILRIINRNSEQISDNQITLAENAQAIEEIQQYLQIQSIRGSSTTMSDIHRRFQDKPYGFREIEIAGMVASLINKKLVTVSYGSTIVANNDKRLVDYLRKKTEIEKVVIKKREALDERLLSSTQSFAKEFFQDTSIPKEEDDLTRILIDRFRTLYDSVNEIFKKYSYSEYPDKEIVQEGKTILETILSYKNISREFLKEINQRADDLLDWKDRYNAVKEFFATQVSLFDNSRNYIKSLEDEQSYFTDNPNMIENIQEVKSILSLRKPYAKIPNLPNLTHKVELDYKEILGKKIDEAVKEIEKTKKELLSALESRNAPISYIKDAEEELEKYISNCRSARRISQMNNFIDQVKQKVALVLKHIPIQGEVTPLQNLKVRHISRSEIIPIKVITNESEIDSLVEELRGRLKRMLAENDKLNIS